MKRTESGAARRTRRPPRRTQEERTAATREKILDATLASLQKHGHAGTSISTIVKLARVSRGALLHHFDTKAELVAASMVRLYQLRLAHFQQSVAGVAEPAMTLVARLRIMREHIERWFPVTLEFQVALRTDHDLQTAFSRAITRVMEPMSQDYGQLFPEFSGSEEGLWVQYVVGCFARGLCLEAIVNKPAVVERIFEQFAAMLESHARELRRTAPTLNESSPAPGPESRRPRNGSS
ncbi:MAG TPA: TetR/AcrR family transcriptional regulator [Steroidobacteraceae bacterium]